MSFERYGRLYYLDPGDADYGVGDRVLVPTESGLRSPSACGRQSGSRTRGSQTASLCWYGRPRAAGAGCGEPAAG